MSAFVVDTLPTGTIRVLNQPQSEGSDTWRIAEDLRIGTIEGPADTTFGDIRGITVDSSGQIYVLDAQSSTVHVFNPAGQHLLSFGRRGAGPAEFQQPTGIAMGPNNRIWVADPANLRYSVFTLDGEFETSTRHVWGAFRLVWPGVITANGNVLEEVSLGRWPHTRRLLEVFDPATRVSDTLPLPAIDPEVFDLPHGKPYVPYAARLITRFDPRGFVWFVRTDRYRIYQTTLAGDTIRIIENNVEPVQVEDEERAEAIARIERLMVRLGQANLDYSRIPKTRPTIENIYVDDLGRVWVRRPSRTSVTSFDIFGTEGRLIASADADFEVVNTRPVVVRENSVYGVVRDSLDVQYVVRGRATSLR